MPDHARATALLTIDLDAIVANWRLIAARVAPAEAAAVVKADAYGLGAGPVAAALAAAGCRTFFVATIDEGIALRAGFDHERALRAGLPEPAILVLCGALPGSAADLVAHRRIPVLNSLGQVAEWAAAVPGGEAALHLDTGMSRLGMEPAEVARVAAEPSLLAGIRPVLVMSHMACADEAHSDMNAGQLAAFRALSELVPAPRRSLSASSALFLGADYAFDMVRPGAALYGVNPTPDAANPMTQVVRLQGKIVQVRDVDSPMTVGYGASHRVARPGRIATVALGYADGWFRSLGNRGHGVIGGVRVPVVGRISMDLTTFDVSDAPAGSACPGRWIEVIGPSRRVDDVAAEAGTIGYEILTALGRRYARSYMGGAR